MAHMKTSVKTKKKAKRRGKNIKKILCIVVLVLSLLLLAADMGFYVVTNKMTSQVQNFSFSTSGSLPGMNFGEDSTESGDWEMPSMPSGSRSEWENQGGASGSSSSDSSASTDGGTSSDSASGRPSMPSGSQSEWGNQGGPSGSSSSDSSTSSDSSSSPNDGTSSDSSMSPNGGTSSDSASGRPSMPSGSQSESGSPSGPSGSSSSDSSASSDGGTSSDSVSGMPSGMTFPSMNSDATAGISKLIAIRKFCIPAAIVLALIALLCIFFLIRIHRQEKKQRTNLLTGPDGVMYGEDGNILTEEEAEAQEARRAVEESIAKRSRAKRRNAIFAVILVVLLILLAAASGYIKSEQAQEDTSIEKETLSGTVERGTLNTTLQGYGTLAAEESADVTIPGSVTVVSYAVSNGDTVEAGDLIATVDKTTVLSSIAELQTLMDELDEELNEVADETISDQVTAAADGRIMAIYAEEDTSVVDTMYANQALLIISLDGLMAIDFSAEASGQNGAAGSYTVGTSITVETEDGDTYTGRVANIDNDTVTVTVTDDGPQLDQTVTLKDSEGNTITSGQLYVHSPLKVTGFAGTVDEIDVAVGDEVEAGDTLLTLTDTEYSANYDTMIQQREVLENQMAVLMRAYMTGGVYAGQKGVISGIDSTVAENGENSSEATISRSGTTYGAGSESQTIYTITVASAGEETVNSSFSGSESSAASGITSEMNSGSESSSDSGTSSISGGNTTGGNTTGGTTTGTDTSGGSSSGDSTTGGGTAGGSTAGGSTAGGNITGGTETGDGAGEDSDSETTDTLSAEQLSELVEWLLKLDSATLNQILSQLDYSVLKPIYDAMTGYKSAHSSEDGDTTGGTTPGGTTPGTETEGTGESTTPGDDTTSGGGTLPSGSSGTGTSSGTDISSIIGSLTGGTGSSGVSSANISASAASAIMSSSQGTDAESTEEDTTNNYTFSETVLCTLTPDDTMTVDITVDELDILSVLVNTGVQVTLDAFEGQSFDGTITYIDTDGSNSGGDTKYTVTVTIDRTEDMLTGMNANVNITLDTKEDVLTVPIAAIFEENDTAYIYTGYDEKKDELTDPVEITTGISDGTNAEILSGLEEGTAYYYQYAGTVIYNFINQE